MKHILYIAPHAYPIKSSESICNSKVAFALAQAGYKVDVFTCADPSTYPADQRIDDYLKDSENIKIKTVNYSRNFSRKASFISNFKNLFVNLKIWIETGYFYNGISTPYAILNAVEETIKEYQTMPYDVIITRGYLTDLVGVYMKKKYGIKWIANWNDPFPAKRFPAPYGMGHDAKLPFFQNKMVNAIQKYADIHTFPSDRLRNYMLKCFKQVNHEQTYVIHHMAHSGLTKFFTSTKEENKILKIVSCGSVGKPRKPEVFLNALAESLCEMPTVLVKCYFVGYYDDKIKQLVDEKGLATVVEFVPPRSYSDCMAFISTCDISLIIETSCEEGIYLPTKVVDAVQCELPIFCVSPKIGTLRDIVQKDNIGYVCDIEDPNNVKQVITQMLQDFSNGNLPSSNRLLAPEFFEDFIAEQYNSII